MKRLMILAVIIALTGCGGYDPQQRVNENYRIVIIEGCEYIYYEVHGSHDFALTHKGNCKNHQL